MEAQGRTSGGGDGTDAAGEGEDEESSSSSSSNNVDRSVEQLRSLLEDENQSQLQLISDQKAEVDGVFGQIRDGGKDPENALEEFRQQWRSELQKGTSKTNSRDASPSVASVRSQPSKESTPSNTLGQRSDPMAPQADSDIVGRASRLYQSGIDFERQGKMHDAIRCYRQALQLVPDIERRLLASSTTTPASGRSYANVASDFAGDKQRRHQHGSVLPSTMTPEQLIEIFRHRLFVTTGGTTLCLSSGEDSTENGEDGKQEDQHKKSNPERNAMHISKLPVELLMKIFKWVISSELDMRQLEQLSMVCGGFYIAARDPELWRIACVKIWGVRLGILDHVYPTWRQMFIDRPHMWYNGVYISKITYVRHGETAYQDQFYRPWHLVIYYRYLKFFADGTMLMLTTPDEPPIVVPGLKWKQPRFQGLLRGTYRLVGHSCVAGVLTKSNIDPTSSPYIRNRLVKQPTDLMEHVFSLVLDISSAKYRRHVQLSWSNYEVMARYRNGQTSTSKFELCEQNFPPMYFSRVKSFSATSEAPLE